MQILDLHPKYFKLSLWKLLLKNAHGIYVLGREKVFKMRP